MTSHQKIVKAVKYTAFAKKDAADVNAVNFYLSADQKISQERLDEFHAAAARMVAGNPKADAEPEAAPEPWIDPAPAPEPVAVQAAPEPEPTPALTMEDVRDRAIAADRALGEARLMLAQAQDALKASNARLATCVTQFQITTGTKRPTQSEFFKRHAIEQNEIRRKIAAGELPPPVRRDAAIGRSAIDRSAAYQRGGNPAGGGRAYARGAMPSSARGRPNFDPARGPVVKVPSER